MKIKLQQFLYTLIFFFAAISSTFADPPGPPDPGSDPGGGIPVGAPIDDGIFVLLALAVIYAGYKVYEIRKKRLTAAETKSE